MAPTTTPDRLTGAGCSEAVNPGNPNRYIRTECFRLPSPVRLRGNSGRNILTGPGITNVDVSASKRLRLPAVPERFSAILRMDVFNTLNGANFSVPGNVQLFNPDGSAIGSAGVITSTTTPSRQIQMSLRLDW